MHPKLVDDIRRGIEAALGDDDENVVDAINCEGLEKLKAKLLGEITKRL